ncbi:MAG: hypothetical protein HOM96_01550 [Rickettsiales bacterium]|jgi:hypothetical protein|nr:hypothetical protein [Rickettsiales bacterium]
MKIFNYNDLFFQEIFLKRLNLIDDLELLRAIELFLLLKKPEIIRYCFGFGSDSKLSENEKQLINLISGITCFDKYDDYLCDSEVAFINHEMLFSKGEYAITEFDIEKIRQCFFNEIEESMSKNSIINIAEPQFSDSSLTSSPSPITSSESGSMSRVDSKSSLTTSSSSHSLREQTPQDSIVGNFLVTKQEESRGKRKKACTPVTKEGLLPVNRWYVGEGSNNLDDKGSIGRTDSEDSLIASSLSNSSRVQDPQEESQHNKSQKLSLHDAAKHPADKEKLSNYGKNVADDVVGFSFSR